MKPENFTIRGIKNFRKELAVVIRIKKHLRKQEQNQNLKQFSAEAVEMAQKESTSLENLRVLARHYNIAYAEFRGKARSQIENKTGENTRQPDESLILSIKEAMAKAMTPVVPVNPVVPEVMPNAS
jgi:hypothetical protein